MFSETYNQGLYPDYKEKYYANKMPNKKIYVID